MAEDQTQAPPPINPPHPANPTPPPANPDNDARMWNMLCHLSALAGLTPIPLANILGPLIVWQIKKNQFPSVDIHGKASVNFQISVTIAIFVGLVAAFALHFFCIGFLLFPIVGIIWLLGMIFAVVAAIKANNGEDYKYPWSLELIK